MPLNETWINFYYSFRCVDKNAPKKTNPKLQRKDRSSILDSHDKLGVPNASGKCLSLPVTQVTCLRCQTVLKVWSFSNITLNTAIFLQISTGLESDKIRNCIIAGFKYSSPNKGDLKINYELLIINHSYFFLQRQHRGESHINANTQVGKCSIKEKKRTKSLPDTCQKHTGFPK